jgi:hypothetical protein
MKVTLMKSWMLLVIFTLIFLLAGGALAEPKFIILGPNGGGAVSPQTLKAPTPGSLASRVTLTPGQIEKLSGAAELAIYGPHLKTPKEQLLQMHEGRAQEVTPLGKASRGLQPSVARGGQGINARDTFFEDLYTTWVTQSEVSSAVYGNHVVAGWNDFETLLFFNSISNWAVSHDRGNTWQDSLSGLPTDATITQTFGDPALDVGSDGAFYYATLAEVSGNSGIAVYQSTDNGNTFSWWSALFTGDPADFLDKELIAVDRINGKVYVSFTYFDNASPFYAIWLWNVTDGILTVVSSNDDGLQGSIPVVGPDGSLYVAYLSWDTFGDRFIKVKKSVNFGASFGSEVDVLGSPLIPGAVFDASSFCLRDAIKGNIRFNEFPSLASDPGTGDLYLVYNARDPITLNLEIYLTRSTDGGNSWSVPLIASDRKAGDFSDRFFPWVSVNAAGQVGIIYYDRSMTPQKIGLNNDNWWFAAYLKRFKVSRGVLSAMGSAKKIGPESPVVVNNDYSAACYMAEYNSISVDRGSPDNTFFLFWSDSRHGDPDIFFYRQGR